MRPAVPARLIQIAGPTRMLWGIARIGRNAHVSRSRFAIRVSTATVTGYGIAQISSKTPDHIDRPARVSVQSRALLGHDLPAAVPFHEHLGPERPAARVILARAAGLLFSERDNGRIAEDPHVGRAGRDL